MSQKMIGYKLFRKRRNGTFGPLFINARQQLVIGETYEAQDVPTKGYAHRPGWHICSTPSAPHLTERGRVWCKVEFTLQAEVKRPAAQGGLWYLGSSMRIVEELPPVAMEAAA